MGLTGDKVGLPYVEHDQRYENADEYLRILYKYAASERRLQHRH